MSFTIRSAVAEDFDFMADMLVESVNWQSDRNMPKDQVLANPDFARYVEGWMRPTDLGVLAVDERGARLGAAWLRYFTADRPGYGYVGDDVPELGMGVAGEHRRKGIGRAILRALLERARQSGIKRVSLSVERANVAAQLYASERFQTVESFEYADTMVLSLGSVEAHEPSS
ncbi:N-acetyltransferase family protein [Phytohabitans sp. LJ34]|uniref:GNAT family N-acetyltransferase n=1 Tax=Phytohabitans sp. LJ34 TaxID=3452217 RepID=UPI003F8A8A4B